MRTPSGSSSRSIGEPSAYSWASTRALLVRHEQLDPLEAAGEVLADPRAQDVEVLARAGRDQHRVGRPVQQPPAGDLVAAVDLVQHQQARDLRRRRSRRAPSRRRPAGRPARPRRPRRRRRAGSGRRPASPRGSTRRPRRARAGSLRMKPTVSVTTYARPRCSNARVVGSRVSKSRLADDTSAPVSAFSRRRLAHVRVAGEGDRRQRARAALLRGSGRGAAAARAAAA